MSVPERATQPRLVPAPKLQDARRLQGQPGMALSSLPERVRQVALSVRWSNRAQALRYTPSSYDLTFIKTPRVLYSDQTPSEGKKNAW